MLARNPSLVVLLAAWLLPSATSLAAAVITDRRATRLPRLAAPRLAHGQAAALRPTEMPSAMRLSSEPHMQLRGGAAQLLTRFVAYADGVPALFILAVTILLEVLATTFMKLAANRGKPIYLVGVYAAYGLCFSLFPLALKRLPLSVAYATWSGVGTAASIAIGAIFFGEKITMMKFLWISLIVTGVVGLNY